MSAQFIEPIIQAPPSSTPSYGLKAPLSPKPTNLSVLRPERTHQAQLISLTTTQPQLSILDKPVNSTSYASILESCKCPCLGKQIHAHTLKTGFHGHEFVETKLLQVYVRCGCLNDATFMFDKMSKRNLHAWVAILSVHVDAELFKDAYFLFLELLEEEIGLDFFVFPIVFKICSGLEKLELGRQLHGIAGKSRFVENIYVGNALIDMYGKCGSLDDAKKVLQIMPEKDCVSWNSIVTACAANCMVHEALDILDRMASDKLTPNLVSWSAVLGGFSQNGYDDEVIELLFRMQEAGFEPNARTLASFLPACARLQRLNIGKEVQGYIMRHGFISNPFLLNGLVDMYRRCSDMKSAFRIFSNYSVKNTVSYNTMIVGYCEIGNVSKAKELFDQMESTCTEKDVISWNSMISGYADNLCFEEALSMFRRLLIEGFEPDSFTLGSVLNFCSDMGSLRKGKEIHSHAIIRGLQYNSFAGGALVEMYSKCQDLRAAQLAFDEVGERDRTTWNALISGYSHCNQVEKVRDLLIKMTKDGFEPNVYTWNGMIAGHVENNHLDAAMELFSEMQILNLRPDIYTSGIIIQVCSRMATIVKGKQVHAYSIRKGYDSDVFIGAALVDMHAKCGSLKHALLAYRRISTPNLVSHNAMLTAYALLGNGEEGIDFFHKILNDGNRPDHVTFLLALSSCVHAGSVEIGYECFDLMRFYNVKPTLKHYTCMVDLLSRAGQLNEAFEFIKKMPMEPDSVLWAALLGGCVIHGDVELGEVAAEKLVELEPSNTGNYVMLANLYAQARHWNDLARTRQLIKDRGMHKSPGCSWIEDRDEIHVFLASDKSHKKVTEIHATLNNLMMHMKAGVYNEFVTIHMEDESY